MATRTIYAGQTVQITTPSADLTGVFAVQSASCDVARPIEFIPAYGHVDPVGAGQNTFTTCKSDIKLYLETGAAKYVRFDGAFINSLVSDASKGYRTKIVVAPNGFTFLGQLNKLGLEVGMGSFGFATLSFNGLGEPFFDTGSAGLGWSEPKGTMMAPIAITPTTSSNVAGSVTGFGCASSIKFNFDLPSEILASAGENVTGAQTDLTKSTFLAKFPFKTTIAVDGYGVNVNSLDELTNFSIATGIFTIQPINFNLVNPKIVAKSFNQSVGSVGASYNISLEGTSAIFS